MAREVQRGGRSQLRSVGRRRWVVVWIGHAGVADANFLSTAERRVPEEARGRRVAGVVVVGCQVYHGLHLGRRVDDELARDGDAMGRASGTNDASALPTVVLPIKESELAAADKAVCDIGVRLPRRQHQITLPPGRRCSLVHVPPARRWALLRLPPDRRSSRPRLYGHILRIETRVRAQIVQRHTRQYRFGARPHVERGRIEQYWIGAGRTTPWWK